MFCISINDCWVGRANGSALVLLSARWKLLEKDGKGEPSEDNNNLMINSETLSAISTMPPDCNDDQL
ncbi:hypothetical protein BLOT_000491 [Blomia tropicalis]|nr:hypothetical protein BLOT_000491 [Blomia tropicalis]